ncbi:hypothetical protein LXL04_008826 [Taraxacum kok-saghyz]
MRIPKQINKITRLTVISKKNYRSLGFSKRNHSSNKTVAGASCGYPTSLYICTLYTEPLTEICGQCKIMRIPKQINKITRLTVFSKKKI